MDAVGTGECINWLRANAPGQFDNAQLTEHGDAKTREWHLGRWTISKCKCHKGKNIPVCLNRKMSGILCKCANADFGGKSCINISGRRYQDAVGRKAAARYYKIVHDAEVQYIPELHNPAMLSAGASSFVGTPEREVRRQKAIAWAKTEVLHMALHFRGDHEGCPHGDLPSDHPAVRCEAQQQYLAEMLHSLADCMGEVLTPFGAMDINSTESLHAVLRRYRPKGEKWGAAQCFLGETMGILHWQRMQLAFWQPDRSHNPKAELARLIEAEIGIYVPLELIDIEEMEKDLDKAVAAKEARLHPSWKTRRARYRAEKLGYAARSAASSTYQGRQLGGAAAAPTAAEQAEMDFLGSEDGGAGLDPLQTKDEQHAADMSTADPQPVEFEVEGEDEEGQGGGGARQSSVAPARRSMSNRPPVAISL